MSTQLSLRSDADYADTSDTDVFADGLPQPDWRCAASALLRAVGFHDDLSAIKSLRQLARYLRDNGFSLKSVSLINHTIPSTADMLGAVLKLDDGFWLAVRGKGDSGIVRLAAPGEPAVPVGTEILQSVDHAWVLSENTTSLNSVAPFLRRYKGHFVDLFLAATVVNLFALTLPLFSCFVYDKILGNGITETLWALVIGIMIVIGIEFCVKIVRVAIAERFAIGSEVDIDHTMFRNLLGISAHKLPSIGGLLEKYKQILSFRDFLSSSYLLALADIPFLFFFLFTIAFIAGPLVLVAAVSGLVMLVSSLLLTIPALDYERQSRVASERRLGLIADILTSREAIIGGAMRHQLAERWRHASVSSVQASSKSRYWRGVGFSISTSVSYVSFIAILAGGVYMVEAHTLTSGGLLASSMLTSRTMGNFSSISTLIVRYREFRTALRELSHIVPASHHTTSVKSHGVLQGSVCFDRVTCRLRKGDMPVLDNVSLNLRPGEIVGIAGAPGAGKTTLLRLLAGIIQPDEGKILIDNIPLERLSPEDISQNLGFKPQDCCLLSGTVEDNVCAGREILSPEIRQDVLLSSGLLRIFNEGSLNWTTDVGARGANLSGGQRQLVALARAMLTRPPLLLLDEPTNGLDASLEAHLSQQIARMSGHSTVLVSTHSRNILSICDRILVIGQSRILADGPRNKILV